MIKRIDPNAPKVPLKDFEPQTRVNNPKNIDPELLKMMKQYQKRGVDVVEQLAKAQAAEQFRLDAEAREEAEKKEAREAAAFFKKHRSLQYAAQDKVPHDPSRAQLSGIKIHSSATDAAEANATSKEEEVVGLPADIVQQIAQGKTKLDDTHFDTHPKREIITREQYLKDKRK